MSTFTSKYNEQELNEIITDLYSLDTQSNDLSENYAHLLAQQEKHELGASTQRQLSQKYAALPRSSAELRYYLPSTFSVSSNSDWSWLFQTEEIDWPILQELLKKPEIKTALLLVPIAWQLGALFYNIAQSHGVTVIVFDEANHSSAELVLNNHPIDLLITTSNGLQHLIERTIETHTVPKTVLIIEPWGKTPLLLPLAQATIFYDIQLSPGISIAYKTDKHEIGTTFTFTAAHDYLFEHHETGTFITSLKKSPVQLVRFKLEHDTEKNDHFVSNAALSYVQQ